MDTFSLENWMQLVDDDTMLTRMTIPGTHDSSTYLSVDNPTGLIQCQYTDFDFMAQLNAGVRFLDIRCAVDGSNLLELCHDIYGLGADFSLVLNTCSDFLNANPTETILLSLKQDADPSPLSTDDFETAFKDNYYTPNQSLFYAENSVPNLGDVRGKIVLLRRFDSTDNLGVYMDFDDNTSFENPITSTLNLIGEDLYEPDDVDDKIAAITANLQEAVADQSEDNLYISFTSATIPDSTTPEAIAGQVNPIVQRLVIGFGNHNSIGIVPMDYMTSDLATILIFQNADFDGFSWVQCVEDGDSYAPYDASEDEHFSFGDSKGYTWIDSSDLVAPKGQVAMGFQLALQGNRIYPCLQFGEIGSSGTWTKNQPVDDQNYFPQGGSSGIGDTGSDTVYIDTNPVLAPIGQVVIGAGFYQKGNRVAPKILCGTPSKNFEDSQWYLNSDSNADAGYFVPGGNLSDFYMETNTVPCDGGNVMVGLALCKGVTYGNRVSSQVMQAPASHYQGQGRVQVHPELKASA